LPADADFIAAHERQRIAAAGFKRLFRPPERIVDTAHAGFLSTDCREGFIDLAGRGAMRYFDLA
jgi:hypothetical protein